MPRFSTKAKVDIIQGYADLIPMIELAKRHGISRQGVWKIIKTAGVPINDKPMNVSCSACGAELKRPRNRIRCQKNHFCSYECHYAYIEAGQPGKYVESRQGTRIARKIISQYFPIEPQHISHHKDRNQLNNHPMNLMVFRNRGDHIRFHRGFEVEPLWDGAKPKDYIRKR